jgi:hypothetical protein
MSYDMEDDSPGFYGREQQKPGVNPFKHERSDTSCSAECQACIWERFGMSPYGHEIDVHGMKCASDCGACTWVAEKSAILKREKVFAMKERLGYPTEPVVPTLEERMWLKSYQIAWDGDMRA